MNKTTKIRKKTVLFAVTAIVGFAKNQRYLKKNLEKKNNTKNSDIVVWKIIYYKNDPSIVTIFPVH